MQVSHFFNNTEGLNLTDSPFFVKDGQATGGYNYDYVRTGGIQKIRGLLGLNAVADTQLKSLGFGTHITDAGLKTNIRAAGTKIQTIDISSGLMTNQSEDTTTAGTDFLASGSTQPIVTQTFNNGLCNLLWMAGGGLSVPYAYTGSQITQNGVTEPTGTFTVSNNGSSSGGAWVATGNYYYALVLRKRSTQALSNAALDKLLVIATTTDTGLLTFPTGIDTATYDKWYVYRSSVGGVTSFTAGTLIAQVPVGTLTYTDIGSDVVASAQNVPRAGNAILDNSSLPTYISGVYSWTASANFVSSNVISYLINGRAYSTTYGTSNAATLTALATQIATDTDIYSATASGAHTIIVVGKSSTTIAITGSTVTGGSSQATIAVSTITTPVDLQDYTTLTSFKKRLATSQGNTLCLSDTNKSESWPTGLRIVLPTGGPITGLSVIGYNTNDGVNDEYLVIFKERETWILSGTTLYDATSALYDVELKFIDAVGCINQALVVRANGYVCWIDYRGVYMWNGQGKPVYCSRPIEALFSLDGDLDKPKLPYGWGVYFRKKNQIIWTLSHRTKGENKLRLKLDLRLSSPKTAEGIVAGVVVSEGVFCMDAPPTALYAGMSTLPSDNEEAIITGDDAGFAYKAYYAVSDNGSGIDFSYQTKALDLGLPVIAKQFSKVVVYIDQTVAKDLTLDYWAGYRVLEAEKAEINVNMDNGNAITGAFWDLATWDVAFWDDSSIKPVPLVFNLGSSKNNNQGDSIMLKFIQNDSSTPVTIHGFSIFWDELSARK